MWILTPVGFVSVVSKRGEQKLQVRARCKEDLDNVREEYCKKLGPTLHTPRGDYHWRALVSRDDWARAMSRMARSICYENFKNQVKWSQGEERAHLYGRIWSLLLTLQYEDKRAA